MSVRLVVTVTSNLLPQVARRLPKQAEAAVKTTLDAGKETVVSGMQASSSPSAPGEMPGIDTGALVGSIATQQAGAAVVPTAATWTLTDKAGVVINSRSAVSLAPVTASEEIVLSGADLALTGTVAEERIVTVKSTYTSSLGVGLTFNEEIRFLLVPLTMVS